MKEIINNMKSNLSVLVSGQESPFFYSFENFSGRKNTRKLTHLLNSDFNRVANRKDTNKTKKNNKIKFNLLNNSKLNSKNNTFLFDLTKISPLRSLEYQLQLYDQKNKFGSENYDNKILYTPRKNENLSFLKKKPYFKNNNYSSSKNIHKKIYSNLNIDKYSHNKNSNKKNNNNSCFLFDNYVNSTNRSKNPCTTNISMNKTNSSRPYSSRVVSISRKNLFAKNIRKKIEETVKKVNDADFDLKNDIINSNKYDNLDKLSPNNSKRKKMKKNKSCIDIKKIIKELRLDEDSKTYEKKNLEHRYKYLDKNCQKILKQTIGIIKNQDRILGKNFRGKFYDLNNKTAFQELKKQIKDIGKNILSLKKKFKGDKAILPDSDVEYLHKLIRENMYNNNDQNYLDESISQFSIFDRFYKSTDKKIAKRLAFLLKQNKAKRKQYLFHS